jgi:TetR/AcrR family transcriptional repressor of nem operon
LKIVRSKGYAAARIEDICAEAGVTKGSFFHHFKSKEDLALAAAAHWEARTGQLFAAAPYHEPAEPLARLLAYIDFRKAILSGSLAEFTCFAGTIVQETYATHPDVSETCSRIIYGHAETLEADIQAAMRQHGVAGDWTARSLALHTQAVLQGSFILAKASGGSALAVDSLDHLRRYLQLLFSCPELAGREFKGRTRTRKKRTIRDHL